MEEQRWTETAGGRRGGGGGKEGGTREGRRLLVRASQRGAHKASNVYGQ